MCDGEIITPSPEPRQEVKKRSGILKSLMDYLRKINNSAINYQRVNYLVVDSDFSKVNMCPKCGDLQIDYMWLNIPNPQKYSISSEIKLGRIIINGHLVICNSCSYLKKEIEDKSNWMDLLPHTVSTMSF